jgi:hypothetical protein
MSTPAESEKSPALQSNYSANTPRRLDLAQSRAAALIAFTDLPL